MTLRTKLKALRDAVEKEEEASSPWVPGLVELPREVFEAAGAEAERLSQRPDGSRDWDLYMAEYNRLLSEAADKALTPEQRRAFYGEPGGVLVLPPKALVILPEEVEP